MRNLIIITGFLAFLLCGCRQVSGSGKNSFGKINAPQLKVMLEQKDFVFIDVHIPEQTHIKETDLFIPYNAIDKYKDLLPDKDKKIVLYCRSGSMSAQAAQELVDKGYRDVSHLVGGINAWKDEGFKVDGPGPGELNKK